MTLSDHDIERIACAVMRKMKGLDRIERLLLDMLEQNTETVTATRKVELKHLAEQTMNDFYRKKGAR